MSDEELKEVIAKADAEYDMLKDKAHEQYDEIQRLNSILDTLEQDMALLNATGIKEIKPKYVFDRIVMLREGVDKE